MLKFPQLFRRGRPLFVSCLVALCAVVAAAGSFGQQGAPSILRIGTSGTLATEAGQSEQSALDTLRAFIKDETGLENEILRQKDWKELADKMTKGELQVGVFQGYEFAWAKAGHAGLKPLAVAVNVYRYPVAYIVAARKNPANDFAGLKGQSLAIPANGQRFLRLFVERRAQQAGGKPEAFFSKIVSPDSIEDAIDDVVDGVANAIVVDRATLEGYKQRKPARFNRLKEITHSKPFPPTVVAYYGNVLDEATRQRLRQGLLTASQKERGQTMLTLFRLTGFELPPQDFAKVLADTRERYSAPKGKEK